MEQSMVRPITDGLLHSPEMYVNPYPFYAQLFETAPVYWNETTQCWYLARYDHVAFALRDSRFSANRFQPVYERLPPLAQEQSRPLFDALGRWALLLDPPDHTRLRKLLSAAWRPTLIAAMRPRIQMIVDELLGAIPVAMPFDLIRDLANPLPIIIIAEMLGADPNDRAILKQWSTDIACFFGAATMTKAIMDQAQQSIQALMDYFRRVCSSRRVAPRPDLMTYLLEAEADGLVFDEEELLASCVMMLFGGHETTTNLIGNGVLALLNHPDQLALIQTNPALIKPALEEICRFDSPVQRLTRLVTADLELDGIPIRAGQRVMLLIGAANHDPHHFDRPTVFDLSRDNLKHLAFGTGTHFCLGTTLARLEGEVALTSLFQRPGQLRLISPPTWQPNLAFRALATLPVIQDADNT